MLGRSFKNLGKLNQEQKEQTWKTSVSGSQAWMLINEPYNLIRDKLGIPRIHKSKYDILDSGKLKAITTNAKAKGTLYEPYVFKEEVIPLHPDATSKDETFKLFLFDGNGSRLDYVDITSTPDYYIKKDKDFILIGDIKVSKQAGDENEMLERYKWQALHNCYVANCKNFELAAKGYLGDILNVYQWEFSDSDFEWYENKLTEFFTNVLMLNITAYDSLYQDANENGTLLLKPMVEYTSEDPNEIENLEALYLYKQQAKELEAKIKEIEGFYKTSYDNVRVIFNNKVLEMKASEQKGTVDYKLLLKDNNIGDDIVDAYRKEPVIRKLITFKNVD